MDTRIELQNNDRLLFPGMECTIDRSVGRGSNVIAYVGHYKDHQNPDLSHRVLIRELYPYDPKGRILRDSDGSIHIETDARPLYEMNRRTFLRGNEVHIRLLENLPTEIDLNINTFEYHNTLYSLVGYTGGRNLYEELGRAYWKDRKISGTKSLLHIVRIVKGALDVLQAFHQLGYLHLDISPDNILLIGEGEKERMTLIDYNSVHTLNEVRSNHSVYYSTKEGFTAPEVRMGRNTQIREWTDLYSMTAVLYLCLTGQKLTSAQMIGTAPVGIDPLVHPFLKGCPETVLSLLRRILRRGLAVTPRKRYQKASQMMEDLTELEDRILGRGITHWALWEAGRRQVERLIRENPSLSFIRNTAALFPSMVSDGKNVYPIGEYIRETQKSCLITGGGGMGKTTSLLRIAFSEYPRYAPDRPAIVYLSLYGWQQGDNSFIINSLLNSLLFNRETHTYEDARKALYELLDPLEESSKSKTPVLLILLDGLNEITGDPKPLLDEIIRLSAFQGVRFIAAGRTDEKTLPFLRLRLTELSDEIVKDALSREGLLLPQSRDMQKVLHTPMMLSMYIRSGQIEHRQIRAENADELLNIYLSALKEKAVRDLPEQTEKRWQIDAAMNLVLPAIASEIHKKQRGLYDKDLLPVVEKCYRLLNGQLSRRFFPQWIGHTAAIMGKAKNAEEWYGLITHDILWKQLGLILRDEESRVVLKNDEHKKEASKKDHHDEDASVSKRSALQEDIPGRYSISHQIIEDYLLDLDRENLQKIQRFQKTRILIFCIFFVIAAAMTAAIYKVYIAPPPYEEIYADNVMERALDAYVKAGKQYERLSDLVECSIHSPELFEQKLELFKNEIPYRGMSAEEGMAYLSDMINTGKVMPWSGRPMDENACRELLTLADSREEEYRKYALLLEYIMSEESINFDYRRDYPELLDKLLETDAKIAAELYQIVCMPHKVGKYADHSVTAVKYERLYSSIPGQNSHLTGEDARQSQTSLESLQGARKKQLVELNKNGVIDYLKE